MGAYLESVLESDSSLSELSEDEEVDEEGDDSSAEDSDSDEDDEEDEDDEDELDRFRFSDCSLTGIFWVASTLLSVLLRWTIPFCSWHLLPRFHCYFLSHFHYRRHLHSNLILTPRPSSSMFASKVVKVLLATITALTDRRLLLMQMRCESIRF
jgi:hypothetical protein